MMCPPSVSEHHGLFLGLQLSPPLLSAAAPSKGFQVREVPGSAAPSKGFWVMEVPGRLPVSPEMPVIAAPAPCPWQGRRGGPSCSLPRKPDSPHSSHWTYDYCRLKPRAWLWDTHTCWALTCLGEHRCRSRRRPLASPSRVSSTGCRSGQW
uniref:Uncharacterized protein n=1 Tax=Nomascus leucogenys TaxID=61853 RepID=A0A2I3H1H6_NOMLE